MVKLIPFGISSHILNNEIEILVGSSQRGFSSDAAALFKQIHKEHFEQNGNIQFHILSKLFLNSIDKNIDDGLSKYLDMRHWLGQNFTEVLQVFHEEFVLHGLVF